ncbi:ferrous iron transport protein B [Parapedobacter koreensis]|uniref:Ferrous iron transport protein B n=1 Tax=Parapedobacter koreensis TaxID=332977 RepID=A0A1H7G2C3_9SPHI|nr:ferrous iron transport protein B [Parapedobacter koreensis]SEK32268.1 ferrous iron transport protein B [Parapedobacter koreensis]
MTEIKIALVGNPNVGKSTVFNKLTGLRQKVGNYPGITVEKKTGSFTYQHTKYQLIDLPGAYGIHPSSLDEEIVYEVLANKNNPNHPELVVVIGDPFNLKRSALLYQQIREMGLPAIFVINMIDAAERAGISIDVSQLEKTLSTKVVLTDARSGKGIDALKAALQDKPNGYTPSFSIPEEYAAITQQVKEQLGYTNDYIAWLYLSQKHSKHLDPALAAKITAIRGEHHINYHRLQIHETMARHNMLDRQLANVVKDPAKKRESFTTRLDNLLIHPFWGYIMFFALLMLIFQAIYTWSGPFMDAIDSTFTWLAASAGERLPDGPINGLLTDGIITGIGGIVIFIPQIAILFVFISLMEESGYMSRVVYLMDRWLRPFGLSGKSAVPLMSGAACAIPAVMSARTIENDKERLITILVTPFMTCSARLPIYIVIIGLVIPQERFVGLDLQGLVLFGMYVLGILAALGSAWILKQLMKTNYKSFLILEMPTYKYPVIRNVLLNVWDKTMGFVLGAGKIILAISIILWVLGSFGVGERFTNAADVVHMEHPELDGEALENEVQSQQLEYSFLGTMGRFIEPAIAPLGYDWKMGIGLISSFAAREVFVSTMATVYSLGGTDDELTIRERMASEINPNTNRPAYNFASGISLLLFYAFAMQCMSTIAIVRKETNSWKWTLIQLTFMTGFAYLAALVAYQLLK